MERKRFYRIQLGILLTTNDAGWFDDLLLDTSAEGGTILLTPAIDQTTLHGILGTIRDLVIPLIAVEPCDSPPLDRHEGVPPCQCD